MDNELTTNGNDYEEESEAPIASILESGSSIPKGDGVDYLRDVNAVSRDIINLLKATHENLERSLSKSFDVEAECILQETHNDHPVDTAEDRMNHIRKDISQSSFEFLKNFKLLIEYIEHRITVSPTQQQKQDQRLRHAVRNSRKTELDMKSLTDALMVQRMEHEKSMEKLNTELHDFLNTGHRRTIDIENEIKRTVNESELNSVDFYKKSVANQELLLTEIKDQTSRLNDLRRNNIFVEKDLRDKRCRVQNLLLNCLAKYDADIGGRHKDMENLSSEFQLLLSERTSLAENVMVDLRKLHEELQREQAAALLKILSERLQTFVQNRAARVIQRTWRAYWERHCAKKKKKSRRK